MKAVNLAMMKADVMAKLMDYLSAMDLVYMMVEMMARLMGC